MSAEQIFSIANILSMCGWLLLIVLPGKKWVTHIVSRHGRSGSFRRALHRHHRYALLRKRRRIFLAPRRGTALRNPWLLLAGWIHYLAFDLLVGSWEVRDARERGIGHLLVVPCLILTFLFGPAGWLLYLGVRTRVPDTSDVMGYQHRIPGGSASAC